MHSKNISDSAQQTADSTGLMVANRIGIFIQAFLPRDSVSTTLQILTQRAGSTAAFISTTYRSIR
jgi:hypothetical protein